MDLNRWTCTCTLFQRNQIACKHAVKAIQHRRGDVFEYVHGSWFKEKVIAALQRGVSGSIIPDWQILHDIVAGG